MVSSTFRPYLILLTKSIKSHCDIDQLFPNNIEHVMIKLTPNLSHYFETPKKYQKR